MDANKFITKYTYNKETVISSQVTSEDSEHVEETIILKVDDQYFKATLRSKKIGNRPVYRVVNDKVSEVVPVEVTTTEYQEVLTLRGTKADLKAQLANELSQEMSNMYYGYNEGYNGSRTEYEEISDENIKSIAHEVIESWLYEDDTEAKCDNPYIHY